MAIDAELRVHRDWIGALQPVGLVVSAPALHAAQAVPDQNILGKRAALLGLIKPRGPMETDKEFARRQPVPVRFPALATEVLGWRAGKLVGAPDGGPLPESLDVVLPTFGETLRPTYAVRALPEEQGEGEWMMLVQEVADGTPLDEAPDEKTKGWHASPQVRLERLLKETGVPIGILVNGTQVRLVYAPLGQSSGHVTWPIYALSQASHKEGLSALCMLLGAARLFTMPREQRLPHILRESRKYQNVVSTKLAGQVLEALNELLRGFQAANEAAKGGLLDATVREDPDHVYGGLLAVLLRLVFVLYAEERGMLSSSATYVRNYSLVGLFDKLRVDAGRFPDTMDQRYGAWSRLLVLFRMIHDGAKRGDLRLPPRHGHLFDPDEWAFVEGRPHGVGRVTGAPVEVPKVPDGVVLRVLEKLLLLDSERLSYRALNVSQLGSVYENMMGFRLERATETSIGVGKDHVVVGLETLLQKKGGEREKHLKEVAGVEVSGKAIDALRQAASIDDLGAALGRRISPLTPRNIPVGGIYLQPTDERRRSGSHYTPSELTEPIVRTTLRPVLGDLGLTPKPDQILALKVCDPAMGSGAFLVETCQQLAERLVIAYDDHGRPADVPPDEDILLYAKRQVAQHCLYGVDKNSFAVDLGKLSLWLATLARDHAFTFLDHSVRHGDSLVGLSREQIASFHWAPEKQVPVIRASVDKALGEAVARRQKIQDLASSDNVDNKRQLLQEADDALASVRAIGDGVVACFFSEDNSKAREEARKPWEQEVQNWLSEGDSSNEASNFVKESRAGKMPLSCFHWPIEFPEVFNRQNPGFDAFVGNPPFMGGVKISGALGQDYLSWLKEAYANKDGNCDLVAYFFRQVFGLLATTGSAGLVATNTISQGDTRRTGLAHILEHGGGIYEASRRVRWPGMAAVVVSIVHYVRSAKRLPAKVLLDGKSADRISAFLFHNGGDSDPSPLPENRGKCFRGVVIYGAGFIIPAEEAKALCEDDPKNRERVFPFLAGEELNSTPSCSFERYVINFGTLSLEEASHWPALLRIVEERVKPERDLHRHNAIAIRQREYWWRFRSDTPHLRAAIAPLKRCLAASRISGHLGFAFQPIDQVFSEATNVIAFETWGAFAVLQTRIHEAWARFFGSSMKDDLRYNPSDCFETFPFPRGFETDALLEAAGREYYEFRAALMMRNDEGLTKTYNRFHDPNEVDSEILKLRELHAAMDCAVLEAYGWTEIHPACEFLLDYEEAEDGAEIVGARRKRKPWRWRWPDDVREDVLARLLELNARRAKEKSTTSPSNVPGMARGASETPPSPAKGAKKPTKGQAKPTKGQAKLFTGEDK